MSTDERQRVDRASGGRIARLAPSNNELVDAGALLGLTAAALWAFESAFGGTEFWVVGVLATIVGLVTSHLTDRLRLPLVASAVVWVLVYVLVGGVLGSSDQSIAGFIPSSDTVQNAVTASVTGWKELLTTVPPVGNTGDLLLLPVLCGMLAATSGLLLARRRTWPIAPVIPPTIVLALGVLCGVEQPVSLLLHGAVFGTGALAWGAVRQSRRHAGASAIGERITRFSKAAVMLCVAAVIGLNTGESMPFVEADDRTVWRDTFEPPFDPSVFPSPLGYYRQFVKELEDTQMFEVSGLPEGSPIRMATLDEYDGIVWKVSGGTRALRGTAGYFERVGTDVDPDYPQPETDVTITFPEASRYGEVWLPTVGEVRSVEFDGVTPDRARQLAEEYRYNRETDTGALLGRPQAGDSYTMTVSVPVLVDDLDVDAVVAASTFDPIDTVPGQVSGLGSGLVEELGGVERLVTLRDFLAQTGFYSDSREGQAAVPPGHGAGRLLQFADASELVGNAEQYAATLGLIYRGSGIPARVVMGFVPGDPDADGTVTVTGTDAEAWVEVLIEDVGWTAIFPTPDRNNTIVVEDDSPRPTPERETQVPPPPPIIDSDAETDPANDSEQVDRDPEDEEEDDEDEPDEPAVTPWLVIAGVVAVGGPLSLTILVMATIVTLKTRRRSRRRNRGRPDERISNGWREVVDVAVDGGRDLPLDETRRVAARRMQSDRLSLLAWEADAAVFGGAELDDDAVERYWEAVDEARRAVRSELSLRERMKAVVSLDSFRRAKAERRAAEQRARVERRRRAGRSRPKEPVS